MPLTYITTALIRERLRTAALDATGAEWLEQCGLAAEDVVDRYTRGPVWGTRAFAESASETRYFDDPNTGVIRIDDAQEVTALTRAGTALTVTTDYNLYPYNKGTGPYTEIYLTGGAFSMSGGPYFSSSSYGYPYRGIGIRQIAVTGTWGFCTLANLPPAVKEAVLRLAVIYHRMNGIKTVDWLNAVSNPMSQEWSAVKSLLQPYVKGQEAIIV